MAMDVLAADVNYSSIALKKPTLDVGITYDNIQLQSRVMLDLDLSRAKRIKIRS